MFYAKMHKVNAARLAEVAIYVVALTGCKLTMAAFL